MLWGGWLMAQCILVSPLVPLGLIGTLLRLKIVLEGFVV